MLRCHHAGGPAGSLPDDVIIVSQVELLGVVPGVVDHAHSRHKVDQLLAGRVVEVVAALVASVPVDPLQPQLAARRRLVRHGGFAEQRTPSGGALRSAAC